MAMLLKHSNRKVPCIQINKCMAGDLVRLGEQGDGAPAIVVDNPQTRTWPATNLITGSPVHYTLMCVRLGKDETLLLSN